MLPHFDLRYFLLLKMEVPPPAQAIFAHSDVFRQQISSLDLICSIYNKVRALSLSLSQYQ